MLASLEEHVLACGRRPGLLDGGFDAVGDEVYGGSPAGTVAGT
jgi:hypothetical protein